MMVRVFYGDLVEVEDLDLPAVPRLGETFCTGRGTFVVDLVTHYPFNPTVKVHIIVVPHRGMT